MEKKLAKVDYFLKDGTSLAVSDNENIGVVPQNNVLYFLRQTGI